MPDAWVQEQQQICVSRRLNLPAGFLPSASRPLTLELDNMPALDPLPGGFQPGGGVTLGPLAEWSPEEVEMWLCSLPQVASLQGTDNSLASEALWMATISTPRIGEGRPVAPRLPVWATVVTGLGRASQVVRRDLSRSCSPPGAHTHCRSNAPPALSSSSFRPAHSPPPCRNVHEEQRDGQRSDHPGCEADAEVGYPRGQDPQAAE